MKLYISTKRMIFEEDNIEHEIVLQIRDVEFFGYDRIIDSDILSKNEEGTYIVREQETWWSYPVYEIVGNEILKFNYKDHAYFNNTERRMALALKIGNEYNLPSELKILRKTLKKILDYLEIVDEDFEKYNNKIEEVIRKNPKK